MTVRAHLYAQAGELVAYALPPGGIWLDILAAHAASGASLMPVDVRLPAREQRAIVERARPRLLVTPDDEVMYADPAPIDPERAWIVVATSGVTGAPKLAELPRTALGSAVAGSLGALEASALVRQDYNLDIVVARYAALYEELMKASDRIDVPTPLRGHQQLSDRAVVHGRLTAERETAT